MCVLGIQPTFSLSIHLLIGTLFNVLAVVDGGAINIGTQGLFCYADCISFGSISSRSCQVIFIIYFFPEAFILVSRDGYIDLHSLQPRIKALFSAFLPDSLCTASVIIILTGARCCLTVALICRNPCICNKEAAPEDIVLSEIRQEDRCYCSHPCTEAIKVHLEGRA